MSALHDLATVAGLLLEWKDAASVPQVTADEALIAVLAALSLPADSDAAIQASRERLRAEEEAAALAFTSADVGEPILLPAAFAKPGAADVLFENGTRRAVRLEAAGDGLRLPALDVTGYHRLLAGGREMRLAIAPRQCVSVADLCGDRKAWAVAVQIAALRGPRPAPFGDFGALAETVSAAAKHGADALAISPVHALFPADSARFSPYGPSSRLFLNMLYGDPARAGYTGAEPAGGGLIDWTDAAPARLALLHDAFLARSAEVRDRVEAFRREGGAELERHARFDALHAHFFRETGAGGWQAWPPEYHEPNSEAVRAFAEAHADEVDFYLFGQWLADDSLAAAASAARGNGMGIGLIADLAVGMDGGGSHAWSRREELLTGLSIGAPPDLLGPEGQSWGITGFDPHALRRTGFDACLATLRAQLRHAGGIRIDHALGLRRLWVVPEGRSARDGAYLMYPFDDMLRLLAIESHRANAVVIGEDLGTVPPGVRPKMAERAMLGMRVLWFERDKDDASFTPPAEYDRAAAALTGTHDLATMAGWWTGHDIDWAWKLGRSGSPDEATDRAARAGDRTQLWEAATAAGLTDAPEPPDDQPEPAVDVSVAYVAATACDLAIVPVEDVLALTEQPNLPGTIDEHPNWRRRLPDTADALFAEPGAARRLAILAARTAPSDDEAIAETEAHPT